MTTIRKVAGRIVLRAGAVAVDEACCCCSCDEYRFLCVEGVYSFYPVVWTDGGNAAPMTPETIPVAQPDGTFFVNGQLGGCVGTPGLLQNHIFFPGAACWNSTDPFRVPGAAAARTQWYYRYRLVDDCADCLTNLNQDVQGDCDVGSVALSCTPFTQELCTEYAGCLEAAGIDPCVNPLP